MRDHYHISKRYTHRLDEVVHDTILKVVYTGQLSKGVGKYSALLNLWNGFLYRHKKFWYNYLKDIFSGRT